MHKPDASAINSALGLWLVDASNARWQISAWRSQEGKYPYVSVGNAAS